MDRKNKKDYYYLRDQQLVDRYTHVDYHHSFKNEDVEASAEGLGGSSIKRGNNIINLEQYFREKSKQLLDKQVIQDILDEIPF